MMKAEYKAESETEIAAYPYSGTGTGIVICCVSCGAEFEETCNGRYRPIKYERERFNRQCERCHENSPQ